MTGIWSQRYDNKTGHINLWEKRVFKHVIILFISCDLLHVRSIFFSSDYAILLAAVHKKFNLSISVSPQVTYRKYCKICYCFNHNLSRMLGYIGNTHKCIMPISNSDKVFIDNKSHSFFRGNVYTNVWQKKCGMW